MRQTTSHSIGIVGAGIAGLTLALALQQRGVKVTLYSEKTPEEIRAGRLSNVVIRSAPTRAREKALGVNHWNLDLEGIHYDIRSEPPLTFQGLFLNASTATDMRLYCARLLENFSERGGEVVIVSLSAQSVRSLAAEHDLIVIASGRAALTEFFQRLSERSPYSSPQRRVFAGLFRGVAYPEPLTFDVTIVPGIGEILAIPIYSFEEGLTGIGVEAIPGSTFEKITQQNADADLGALSLEVLDLLRQHAPNLYARVDSTAFAITNPQDWLTGAITPTVRQGYAPLGAGKFAVALGDAHVLNDPLIGQGANTASHSAWLLAELICKQQDHAKPFDGAFCQRAEARVWEHAGPVTALTNERLRPPPPHFLGLLSRANRNQALANAFSEFFNTPEKYWQVVSSPEATAAFIRQFESELVN
jgi:hypothetical protein